MISSPYEDPSIFGVSDMSIAITNGGFVSHGGTPIAGWLIVENHGKSYEHG